MSTSTTDTADTGYVMVTCGHSTLENNNRTRPSEVEAKNQPSKAESELEAEVEAAKAEVEAAKANKAVAEAEAKQAKGDVALLKERIYSSLCENLVACCITLNTALTKLESYRMHETDKLKKQVIDLQQQLQAARLATRGDSDEFEEGRPTKKSKKTTERTFSLAPQKPLSEANLNSLVEINSELAFEAGLSSGKLENFPLFCRLPAVDLWDHLEKFPEDGKRWLVLGDPGIGGGSSVPPTLLRGELLGP